MNQNANTSLAQQLRDIHAIKQQTGFRSTTTIYSKMAREGFPKPINLGTRTKRWLASEVDAWIEQRIAESRGARA